MPRGRPPLSDKVKETIARVYAQKTTLTAKEIEAKVKEQLGTSAPSLSIIQKQLARMREQETDEQDSEWSIGDLAKHELNPAVVPILLREQSKRREQSKDPEPDMLLTGIGKSGDLIAPLTIRQALWASRLYSTVGSLLAKKPAQIPNMLMYWAIHYALNEEIRQLLGVGAGIEAAELDEQLLKHTDVLITIRDTSPGRRSTRKVEKEGGTK